MSAEMEQPEEQQQLRKRVATTLQAAWMEELVRTDSFDDFDLLLDRFTKDLSAEIALWVGVGEEKSGEHTDFLQNPCIQL